MKLTTLFLLFHYFLIHYVESSRRIFTISNLETGDIFAKYFLASLKQHGFPISISISVEKIAEKKHVHFVISAKEVKFRCRTITETLQSIRMKVDVEVKQNTDIFSVVLWTFYTRIVFPFISGVFGM